ncbi:MAG: hypothetical protein RLZZ320_743, partial [Actinomycetota bacterium]
HAIAALLDSQTPLSELISQYNSYFLSGEINTQVADTQKTIAQIREHFSNTELIGANESLHFDDLDGLTVSAANWSFNLRPSNTEPLLRLNVEAGSEAEMMRLQELVLRLMANR